MELIDIRSFEAVARTGSLTRAAKELHVAQPALSRRVRTLERELGIHLLTRHVKGVTLTPAGDAFARESRHLLRDVTSALDRTEETAAGRRGRVVLAATRAAVARGFPAEVEDSLRGDFPELTVVVDDHEQPTGAEAVVDGRADLAVCFEIPHVSGLAIEPLWVETLDRVIVSRDHPLTGRATVSLADLAATPFVFALGSASRDASERAAESLRRAGLQSPVLAMEGDVRAAHLAVAAGRGWTLISHARAQAPPDGTTVIEVTGVAIPVSMVAVWRSSEQRAVVHRVLDRMREVARRYQSTRMPPGSPLPFPSPLAPSRRGSTRRHPGTIPPGIGMRHLRALIVVAVARSIGAGAQQLGITQPALSRQLRELEHALGASLLERSARGVALTPAGAALAGSAPALLAAIDRLVRDAMRAKRGIEGRCVIGAVATDASGTLLRQVTDRCLAAHPQIHVIIRELATPLQQTALTRGDIDIGLAHAFPGKRASAGNVTAMRLVKDRLETALIAAGHRLAGEREVDARSLADIPFLFMARSAQPEFHDRIMSTLAALGLRPRVEATYDSLQTVWALVAQGRGWTIGFRSHLIRAPVGTAAVRIAGLGLPFGLELLFRSGEASPPVRAVISVFRQLRQHGAARNGAKSMRRA